jgi:uncharacterized RDD family membrane protein YckC
MASNDAAIKEEDCPVQQAVAFEEPAPDVRLRSDTDEAPVASSDVQLDEQRHIMPPTMTSPPKPPAPNVDKTIERNPEQSSKGTATTTRSQNASIIWRRFLAALVDTSIMSLVGALIIVGLCNVFDFGNPNTQAENQCWLHPDVLYSQYVIAYLFIFTSVNHLFSIAGAIAWAALTQTHFTFGISAPWVALIFSNVAYSALQEASNRRATFGQWLFGLSVCRTDGSRAPLGRLVARYLLVGFPALTGIGMLSGFINKRGQFLHDWLTGIVVVEGHAESDSVRPLSPQQRVRVRLFTFILTTVLLSALVSHIVGYCTSQISQIKHVQSK